MSAAKWVSEHHDVDLGDIGPARNLRLHVDRQLDAAAENVTLYVINGDISFVLHL
jgi:hypothetical protein